MTTGTGTYTIGAARHKAALGQLASLVQYKANLAGRPFVAVPAAYTSQRCNPCGHVAPGNRESQAVFRCINCGHTANADTNAGRNVLDDGVKLYTSKSQDNGSAGSKRKTEKPRKRSSTSVLAAAA